MKQPTYISLRNFLRVSLFLFLYFVFFPQQSFAAAYSEVESKCIGPLVVRDIMCKLTCEALDNAGAQKEFWLEGEHVTWKATYGTNIFFPTLNFPQSEIDKYTYTWTEGVGTILPTIVSDNHKLAVASKTYTSAGTVRARVLVAYNQSTVITCPDLTITVDADIDRDKIGDSQDQCQNTLSGAQVDAKGCSQIQVDDDLDGVCNAGKTSTWCTGSDQCLNTPTGSTVDTNGCTTNQLDSDSDGVPNTSDQCPNVAGPASNNGCPLPQQCTSFTYDRTAACTNGSRQLTVISSLPTGCTGGNPLPQEPCTGGINASCQSTSQCNSGLECINSKCSTPPVTPPRCTYDCSQCTTKEREDQSPCRIVPDPCSGGAPAGSVQSCPAPAIPDCVYRYTGDWGECHQAGATWIQERPFEKETVGECKGQPQNIQRCTNPNAGGGVGGGGDVDAGTCPAGKICNPVQSNDLYTFLGQALKEFVKILIPIIVIFYVITGLMFITARGNPEKLKVAKIALLGTTIGAAVVLGSWLIAQMIDATIKSII